MKEYGDWCQSEQVPQLTNLNHKNFSDLAVSQTVKKPIPIISLVGTLCVAIADQLSARSTAVLKKWCARALVKQHTLKSASTKASFEPWLTDAGWSTFLAHTGDSGSGEPPSYDSMCVFWRRVVHQGLVQEYPTGLGRWSVFNRESDWRLQIFRAADLLFAGAFAQGGCVARFFSHWPTTRVEAARCGATPLR